MSDTFARNGTSRHVVFGRWSGASASGALSVVVLLLLITDSLSDVQKGKFGSNQGLALGNPLPQSLQTYVNAVDMQVRFGLIRFD